MLLQNLRISLSHHSWKQDSSKITSNLQAHGKLKKFCLEQDCCNVLITKLPSYLISYPSNYRTIFALISKHVITHKTKTLAKSRFGTNFYFKSLALDWRGKDSQTKWAIF